MLTVKIKSQVGRWQEFQLFGISETQLLETRKMWAQYIEHLRETNDLTARTEHSRSQAKRFLEFNRVPELNGFDTLILTSAVMAPKHSFKLIS